MSGGSDDVVVLQGGAAKAMLRGARRTTAPSSARGQMISADVGIAEQVALGSLGHSHADSRGGPDGHVDTKP